MAHPMGAGSRGDFRLDFDRSVRLEFRGSQLSSDGGLLLMRELDEALGLSSLAAASLSETRKGRNCTHLMKGQLQQSLFGRVASYEDVNDAERLSRDPVMRQIVGKAGQGEQGASTSQMNRFETQVLSTADNRAALAGLSGQWIDRFFERTGMLSSITLDMDSSVSPTHGNQEGTVWNGHFKCKCYHPLFVFNQFGMLECCSLRDGNVHSAHDWQAVMEPVLQRYAAHDIPKFFRGDAAFATPVLYERLEEADYSYAIRLKKNAILQSYIVHRLTRPVGRPSKTKVKRFYEDFDYQAQSWGAPRRVIAKIEWHPDELFPRVGFIVTNMTGEPEDVTKFYNQRGKAEQYIKEGKYALNWTRLSCKRFCDNDVRLQLHALAYNMMAFVQAIDLPEPMTDWSLTSLQTKLIKIGARMVRHARTVTFQLAEVAVTAPMVKTILASIHRLRAPPICA